ncbi:glycosyl transferase family 1 [Aestuariibius insulae]|uniref:rhamnosyltransferase WsaF family glycosyltransferase n=1 Tax=Aestuariibius insulae TaxID=2058287 RepID=UPI00345EA6B9
MSPVIRIVLAIYRPDRHYLSEQLASIAAQDLPEDADLRLYLVIADTTSADLAAELAGDLPHTLIEPAGPLDAVRAFEAGLEAALSEAGPDALYALCDQDDIWHPDRLRAGIDALAQGGADLAHADARLIDETGEPLHASMFQIEKRHPKPGLRGLLYRNTITGMTALMTGRLVAAALPFPAQTGVHFYHDLWLGLVAEAMGGIARIDRPLVDYRQHGGNAIGAVDRETGSARPRLPRPDMTWMRQKASGYALARYLANDLAYRAQQTGRPDPAKLRSLRPFLGRRSGMLPFLADAAWMAVTGHIDRAKIALTYAVTGLGRRIWTWRMALGPGLDDAFDRFDTRLFSLSPGLSPPRLEGPDKAPGKLPEVNRKVASWTPDFSETQPSVTILLPSLNPSEIFAGIATAVDLGLGLAREGLRVRFVATDLPIAVQGASRSFVLGRLKPEAMEDADLPGRITLHCGKSADRLPAHKDDIFVATAWWTAHVAKDLQTRFGYAKTPIRYLIQDYEPGFYPWGADHADATASYGFDIAPIFNTTLLRDYCAGQGVDCATPEAPSFHPSIDIEHYAKGQRAPFKGDRPIRLAVYGRPEVARNMFETTLETLNLFLKQTGLTPQEIELVSMGLRHDTIRLENGHQLKSLGKLPFERYPSYLLTVDLALSLMLSPHPSHPPLEMAASGVRVVTNSFDVKDLSALSPAIYSAAPFAPALAAKLGEALTDLRTGTPVSPEDRRIDLRKLGRPLDEVIPEIAAGISRPQVDGPSEPARSDKKILLHIGAPKCGSTYLQNVLLQNRDALAKAGICYPHNDPIHPGNAADIGSVSEAQLQEMTQGQLAILSHEALFSNLGAADPFIDLVQEKGIPVDILVFIRPLSEIVFADYSQYLKENFDRWLKTRNPFGGQSFQAFVKQRRAVIRPTKFVDKWQSRFPDRPITPRLRGDIRETLEALLPPVPLDWTVPPEKTNPSLRMIDCERICEAMRDPANSDEDIVALFKEAHRAVFEPDPGKTPERLAIIDKAMRAESDRFYDRFGIRI